MPPLELKVAMNRPKCDEDLPLEFDDDQFQKKPAAIKAIRLTKLSGAHATETQSLDKTDSSSTLSGGEEGDKQTTLVTDPANNTPSKHVNPDSRLRAKSITSGSRSVPARPQRRRTQSEPVRPRGILKMSHEVIPIAKKATWLNLPKPDMAKVRRSMSTPNVRDSAEQQQPRRRSSVVFDKIQIREYEQTLGDNPSVSYGPPISLDWDYEEQAARSLDDYEHERDPRRSLRQLCMNYYTRRNVLMWSHGYTEEDLKKATKQVEKDKRGRAVTKYFLPVAKMEDLVASAGRKAKRVVGGGKSKKERRTRSESV